MKPAYLFLNGIEERLRDEIFGGHPIFACVETKDPLILESWRLRGRRHNNLGPSLKRQLVADVREEG